MTYMKEFLNEPTVRRPIPTEPLMRIVDQWIEENGGVVTPADQENSKGRMSAIARLSANCGRKDMWRSLYRLRFESGYTTFHMADLLICGTYGPHIWHTDPDLKKALEWMDAQNDYCPDCWAVSSDCECAVAA